MASRRDIEYRKAATEARLSLSVRQFSDPDFTDRDILNLTMMMLEIMPYSQNWNFGCLRSLKSGILALAKERGVLDETKKLLSTMPKYSMCGKKDYIRLEEYGIEYFDEPRLLAIGRSDSGRMIYTLGLGATLDDLDDYEKEILEWSNSQRGKTT